MRDVFGFPCFSMFQAGPCPAVALQTLADDFSSAFVGTQAVVIVVNAVKPQQEDRSKGPNESHG